MSITNKLRDANAKSADSSDSMGVCPFCYDETDPAFKAAQRQHDLQYVMHDAGLASESRADVDVNFRKNLLFAAGGNKLKIMKALVLAGLASAFGWVVW
jgi:hypothetical protein